MIGSIFSFLILAVAIVANGMPLTPHPLLQYMTINLELTTVVMAMIVSVCALIVNVIIVGRHFWLSSNEHIGPAHPRSVRYGSYESCAECYYASEEQRNKFREELREELKTELHESQSDEEEELSDNESDNESESSEESAESVVSEKSSTKEPELQQTAVSDTVEKA